VDGNGQLAAFTSEVIERRRPLRYTAGMLPTARHEPARPFGPLISKWRRARGKSQLDLALDAEVSARHLSFLETGRANPSRQMVLNLAAVLDVPHRERNGLLVAAGFAPLYGESDLEAAGLEPFRRAVELILGHQEPYPAVVMNRHWDIVRANGAAEQFFAFLLAGAATVEGKANVLRLMFHPAGLRPWVANWEQVAEALIQRVHREALGGLLDESLEALLREVFAYPEVPSRLRRPDLGRAIEPLVKVHFARDGRSFGYFSTVTTLGTAQDVSLQELRIECFFPADRETEAAAARLRKERPGSPG
jgi:transcriptional regulator with XRE-family HTH domain